MFLKEDKAQADKEKHFAKYSMVLARRSIDDGDFTGAIKHLRNSVSSVDELSRLSNKKVMSDQADKFIKKLAEEGKYAEQIQGLLGR